ncbi:hypothetical protein [Pantoea sp. VS1]|uniref:hypothetical protein n=1 Tax=Pantoea sp. VS1 TaxID=2003658 RepID=UPI001595DA6C|nr:hypothetical protein [Pantoea sp. VS1]
MRLYQSIFRHYNLVEAAQLGNWPAWPVMPSSLGGFDQSTYAEALAGHHRFNRLIMNVVNVIGSLQGSDLNSFTCSSMMLRITAPVLESIRSRRPADIRSDRSRHMASSEITSVSMSRFDNASDHGSIRSA